MATQTELNQAQLLYVAYYGRPADPAGLEFWAAQIAEVGVAGIAADFGASAEFEAEFGNLGSVALINNLYQQLFGRDAEAEGLQYWLDVLAEGTPLASIAFEIAGGAQGGDATGLQNKVTLANQFTAAVAAGDVAYDGADAAAYGRAFLATINEDTNVENYDVQAVVDAIESGVLPTDTADLRTALQELSDAQQAKADFLEEAEEVEAVEAELALLAGTANEGDVELAISNAFDTSIADLNAADASGATAVAGFADRSVSAQNALVADAVAAAETVVTDAEEAVEDGVIDALSTVESRAEALGTATDTQATAQLAYTAQAASFNTFNPTALANLNLAAGTLEIDGELVAEQRANGTFRLVTQDVVDLSELTNFEALFASVNTLGQAEVATANARTALEEAVVAVVELQEEEEDLDFADDVEATSAEIVEGVDADGNATFTVTFIGDSSIVQNLVAARLALEELNEAVADFEAARELSVDLAELNTAIETAEQAIVDLDFNLIIGTDNDAGTNADLENDVFLFQADGGAEHEINDFGDEGVDRIFFGPDYQLVQLAEGETIQNRVGSASELEIFWEQDGLNLVLYVEGDVTGGNSTGTSDITEITLVGVDVEDISFTSGFLSAGSIA